MSCLSFSVVIFATRVPSKRASETVMSCVLNVMLRAGRRTSSATVSVPRNVLAAASGVSVIR